MTQLDLRHVGLAYDGVPILDDVSLRLPAGGFVAIVGPSGSGKTSLLKIAAGFVQPTRGEALVGGVPIAAPGADRAVVFQDDALFPWLTARDNVAFALRVRGVARAERAARAEETLRLVGLEGFGERHVWQLSGGQRQRVGLARALLADPSFILMDEPFGALDPLTRAQMQIALNGLWARTRKAILLITHDIEEALLLATRVLVLSPGPGRVIRTIDSAFGARLAAGEPARAVRSDPAFVEQREQILDDIFSRIAA
jgi:taurine transport system ATP-binding protein